MNPCRRIAVVAAAFACILAWPPPVGAQDGSSITAFSVGDGSIDLASHTVTVIAHVECAADLWFRGEVVLWQHADMPAGRPAAADRPDRVAVASNAHMDGLPCTAGSAVDVPLLLGSPFGVFSPGRAEISGWVSCPWPIGTQLLEPTTIVLHPSI
jgi:hypothetical protein